MERCTHAATAHWLAGIAALALASPATAQSPPADTARWYRGNTHVHTLESDGNAPPLDVMRWYREHGYDFVVLTDHELVTPVAPLNAALGADGRFLVLPGEEVTQIVADSAHPDGRRHAHVVAIGIDRPILPLGDERTATGISIADTYARNVAAIREAGGLAQVNHPNFRWSVGPEDMAGLPDSTLFEVWNAQPRINNQGGVDASGRVGLSTDALWDTLLTRGTLLYGVASDDAHDFGPERPDAFETARPGGGWVMVRADTLTRAAIVAALHAGEFYSTTGVLLEEYAADAHGIRLRMKLPHGPRDDRRFRTTFIGKGGRVLAEVPGRTAAYAIRGDEGYVRAKVVDSNGRQAWTQPMWVGPQ